MSDSLVTLLYAIWFVVSTLLTAAMWWLAYRDPDTRHLWGPLAIGWGLNLLSSFLWGVYVTLLGAEYPALFDLLYVVRYLFVFLALWLYPTPWPARRAVEILLLSVGMGLLVWLGWLGFLRTATEQPAGEVVSNALFPILDTGVLYATWRRWRDVRADPQGPVMGMLLLSMTSYAVANWIQFIVQLRSPDVDSVGAVFFWLLTDLFAVLAVRHAVRIRRVRPESSG